MTITKTINGKDVTLALGGRLDTVTSIELTDAIEKVFSEGAFNLTLDFKDLEYVSSAGIRVVFATQKQADALGTKLAIVGSNEMIKDVFNVTGFSTLLNIS